MSAPERKLRVGITIAIRSANQTIWENGIGQNCIFLARLLANSPQVGRSVLINANPEVTPGETMMLGATGIDIIPLTEAAENLDVLIEMGAQLPDEWALAFRQRGGRYISMRVGNDHAIDIERSIFDKAHGSLCTAKTFDAVWTIPGHQSMCADYFGITTRSPVRIVPHIWSPLLFQRGIDSLSKELSYGYKPGRKRWRVCSFEPNINMVKTSLIPMLACEEAYRMQPSFIESLFVCNTFHLKEQDVFRKFALSLDIVNHGIATFEGRFPVYDFMARQGDCVISHQWECAQNYLYYEILYGGYPLVHNSPLLRDHGYYYPDFETEDGGKALLHAYAQHDLHLDAYRARCRELIQSLGFDSPENIAIYTEELLRLYGVGSGVVAEPLHLPDRKLGPARGISRAWVVNLDRRPDRLEEFHANHPGLSVERQNAVDGKTLTLTPSLARLFSPNTFGWKKPVMGCALSHLALWTQLASERDDRIVWLILEDDVRLDPSWKEIWEKMLVTPSFHDDWDILYLGGVLPPNRPAFETSVEAIPPHAGRIAENRVFGQNPANCYFHFCTYAYLLNRRGARRLIQRIRNANGIRHPIDHIMCNIEMDDLKVRFLHPLPAGCLQDEEPSYRSGNFNTDYPVSFDSDIRNDLECFSQEEIGRVFDSTPPLDLAAALRDALIN